MLAQGESSSGVTTNKNRVYELRTYESAHEKLGQLKVDMFNNGEVPIFLIAELLRYL